MSRTSSNPNIGPKISKQKQEYREKQLNMARKLPTTDKGDKFKFLFGNPQQLSISQLDILMEFYSTKNKISLLNHSLAKEFHRGEEVNLDT